MINWVTNPKSGNGRLVEVTLERGGDHISPRKRRQIATMKKSGLPYTVLFRRNLNNIQKAIDRNKE